MAEDADRFKWDRLEQRLSTGKWPGTESSKETPMPDRYYLTEMRAGEPVERAAGFRPNHLRSTDPEFMTTPATASFSDYGISGRSRRAPANNLKGPM